MIPIIPPVTLITLVGHEFLDEIASATSIIHRTHCTVGIKLAIFKLLLVVIQRLGIDYIVETIEHDVVIESWVAILIRMLGIPTRLGVQHIFTIPYKIDRLSVSHTILVDYIGCWMVNDIVMIYKTCNLRTE